MNTDEIKRVLEAALLCSASPLSMTELRRLFDNEFNAELLRPLLDELATDWAERPVQLVTVASGWRFQSRPEYAVFINRLAPEKAPKYSRAVMETLAIIAYRQPVTRGDIEEIRGVSVSSQIIKTLEERGWIDVIGHKEVPGRPALFGTTRQFLDDLGLVSIKELPSIDEMVDEDTQDMFNQQMVAVSVDGGGEPVTDSEAPAAPTDESAADNATAEVDAEGTDAPAIVAGTVADDSDAVEAVEAVESVVDEVDAATESETANAIVAEGPVPASPGIAEPETGDGQVMPAERELHAEQETRAGRETRAQPEPAPAAQASEAETDDPEMDELSMLAEAAAAIGLQKKYVPEESAGQADVNEDETDQDPASESLESR